MLFWLQVKVFLEEKLTSQCQSGSRCQPTAGTQSQQHDCQQNRKDWEALGYKQSWEKWEATGQQEEMRHSDKVRAMEEERTPEHY